MKYTASTNRIWLPHARRFGHFMDRNAMRVGHPTSNRLGLFAATMPTVTLPVDWTKANALSFPYDGNDQYGDCMYAAACHGDNTFTGNVGTESGFDEATLIKDYLALSGGDNGLDEGMILGEWKKGLASTPAACIFDSVDVDPNNANLMQAAIYLFGGVQFQLSVPARWISNFATGCVWDAPRSPTPWPVMAFVSTARTRRGGTNSRRGGLGRGSRRPALRTVTRPRSPSPPCDGSTLRDMHPTACTTPSLLRSGSNSAGTLGPRARSRRQPPRRLHLHRAQPRRPPPTRSTERTNLAFIRSTGPRRLMTLYP